MTKKCTANIMDTGLFSLSAYEEIKDYRTFYDKVSQGWKELKSNTNTLVLVLLLSLYPQSLPPVFIRSKQSISK